MVSTPIGNLGDVTQRALDVLRGVDLIVAEDTRHSRALLSHFGISARLSAYHEHNEARETQRLLRRLLAGESVALVSDAGTPLLSDPGARLVRASAEHHVPVVPVPGASALLAALVASGIAADQFTFLGFLPRRGREREQRLLGIAASTITSVLYESPQRVGATLDDLVRVGCGERECALARELTKLHEEIRRGTVASLRQSIAPEERGEFVIVVAGGVIRRLPEADARVAALDMISAGMSSRDVVERLVCELGVARNVAYRIAHERPDGTATD